MPDFDNYMMRHGEAWVQHLVEQIERREGVGQNQGRDLETRWKAIMNSASFQRHTQDEEAA